MRYPRTLICLLPILFLASACGSRAAAQAPSAGHPVALATATLTPIPTTVLAESDLVEQRGRFSLGVPKGYQALEGVDGGCFLYSDTAPGFLVLYPTPGVAAEILAALLSATPDVGRVETPLEVDVGGRTFAGAFLETGSGNRLFLAADDNWALVVQGPANRWRELAAGLNQALISLSFEEENR